MFQRYFKHFLLLLFLLLSLGNIIKADVIEKRVTARNSYKTFEKKMGIEKNDITEAITEFRDAVKSHQDLLKEAPDDNEGKERLLTIINAAYDIGDTFYKKAQEIQESDPDTSSKYFNKAMICYNELLKIYPQKSEMLDKRENANRLCNVTYGKAILKEMNNNIPKIINEIESNTDNISDTLLIFNKIKTSLERLSNWTEEQNNFKSQILPVIISFENNIDKKFAEQLLLDKSKVYFALIIAAQKTYSILPREERSNKIRELKSKLNNLFSYHLKDIENTKNKADDLFNRKDYSESIKLYQKTDTLILNIPLNSIPEQPDFDEFKQIIQRANLSSIQDHIKSQISRCLGSIAIDEGYKALSSKNYLVALNNALEASKYDPNNPELEKLNKKIYSTIQKLPSGEINSYELAKIKYSPIGLLEWLQDASKGNFDSKYVAIFGIVKQQIDTTIILEYGNYRVGLILKKQRLLQEETPLRAIATYKGLYQFTTVLGVLKDIPVFEEQYMD